eukprot:1194503-Prorocentrum_minimum.AAC.5
MCGASRNRHNDAAHLEELLQDALLSASPPARVLVVVEGIYSMEGELARLPAIVKVAKMYGAYVYLDEAHSIGAVGPTGRGVCEELGERSSATVYHPWNRLSGPLRLVPTPRICSLIPCDWFQPPEYALWSPAIGPNPWNRLSGPLRLVPTPGICSLVPCDWFQPLE